MTLGFCQNHGTHLLPKNTSGLFKLSTRKYGFKGLDQIDHSKTLLELRSLTYPALFRPRPFLEARAVDVTWKKQPLRNISHFLGYIFGWVRIDLWKNSRSLWPFFGKIAGPTFPSKALQDSSSYQADSIDWKELELGARCKVQSQQQTRKVYDEANFNQHVIKLDLHLKTYITHPFIWMM